MTQIVYAIATMDTKADELHFVAERLRAAGVEVRTIDVGTHAPPTRSPDISRESVLQDDRLPEAGTRSESIAIMSQALTRFLVDGHRSQSLAGVIGIGGSGGTALITAAMRALPIGLPKLMVSTVASGNTTAYIDCSDITMMPSVVDVAGLNRVSQRVLANAAHAMAGMVGHKHVDVEPKPCLGMTMFGVTTPCVDAVRQRLESSGFDCLVFHATGIGGRAMETLVRSGLIEGVLDLTTTEVADEVVGGIFPAGPDRFDSTLSQSIPLVLSVGAVDMVNFGAIDSVPDRFRDRKFHVHNAQVTLMRTTPTENVAIAEWIATKLNRSTSPYTILLPEGGVSMLDAPGQDFYDPVADQALFETLESTLIRDDHRKTIRVPHHINDPAFAAAAVEQFRSMHEKRHQDRRQ